MLSKIITREKIIPGINQEKMLRSGWGNAVIENTIVEKIFYLSDGLKVKGYIAYPKDQTKKYQCIIWCRGGYKNIGAIDEFNALGMFGQIASRGYVVFAPQYRGSACSEGIDEFGGSDLNDIINIIPLADEIECADKNIWGIEGWSRGGMMTYLASTKTNIFKAAIIIGGITKINCDDKNELFMQHLYESYPNSSDESIREKCRERSIINFPEKLSRTTPILLMHGMTDERVPVGNSIELSDKLKKLNYPHELILFENGDHFLKSYRKEVGEKRDGWFKKFLK
ncbi:MAG: prolyl oligopeptidase family serine peptidase [Ignavibacteriales bacterium]|nr:prolyl oligopeptidase family serine peptidase [Ignavibacteriales bacterium]